MKPTKGQEMSKKNKKTRKKTRKNMSGKNRKSRKNMSGSKNRKNSKNDKPYLDIITFIEPVKYEKNTLKVVSENSGTVEKTELRKMIKNSQIIDVQSELNWGSYFKNIGRFILPKIFNTLWDKFMDEKSVIGSAIRETVLPASALNAMKGKKVAQYAIQSGVVEQLGNAVVNMATGNVMGAGLGILKLGGGLLTSWYAAAFDSKSHTDLEKKKILADHLLPKIDKNCDERCIEKETAKLIDLIPSSLENDKVIKENYYKNTQNRIGLYKMMVSLNVNAYLRIRTFNKLRLVGGKKVSVQYTLSKSLNFNKQNNPDFIHEYHELDIIELLLSSLNNNIQSVFNQDIDGEEPVVVFIDSHGHVIHTSNLNIPPLRLNPSLSKGPNFVSVKKNIIQKNLM